jgi:lipid II:glycine glycyltransferase (peptidoglycan interpeptide bridge formation enzyme)
MFITERRFAFFKFVNVYFTGKPGTAVVPDYDVITYHTYENWGEIEGCTRGNYFTTTIDLSQDLDVIWSKIKRQHRRHIHRAEKDGTTVKISTNYEEFHQIHRKFLGQKNYRDLFGLKILSTEFMQKYGILFIAENQGKTLGGNLYYVDGNNALLVCHAYELERTTSEKYKKIADANCFIHWEAIRYFKNLNITNYDFGGLGSNEITINHQLSGLDYFMRSFGGDVIFQYQYRKFHSYFIRLLFQSWDFLLSLTFILPRLIKRHQK